MGLLCCLAGVGNRSDARIGAAEEDKGDGTKDETDTSTDNTKASGTMSKPALNSELGVTPRSSAITEIIRRRTQVFNRSSSSEPSTSMTRADANAAAVAAQMGALAAEEDYPKILAALDKMPFFSRGVLAAEVRQSIVQNVRERRVRAADVLILEHDTVSGSASEMYIVKAGSFGVYQTQSGSRVLVNKKGRGDFFGEIALFYNCPRTASIVAQVDSTVWVLDRRTFRGHIRRRQQLIRKEQSKLVTFLNSVYIFQRLDGEERGELATQLEEVDIASGEEVLAEGEHPEHLYIVREGAAVLWRTVGDEMMRTDILFPGDFFGFKCFTFSDVKVEPRVTAEGEKLVLLRVPADAVAKLPEDVHRRMRRKLKAFSTREQFLRLESSRTTIQLKIRDVDAPVADRMHGSLEDTTLIDNDGALDTTPKSDADTPPTQPMSDRGSSGGGPKYELEAEVNGIIGSGAYSSVKLVYCEKQKRHFAMKCINKLEAARIKEHIWSERNITSMLLHPLVIRLYGCFQSDVELAILYDYVEGGDLMDLLEAHAHVFDVTSMRPRRNRHEKRKYLRGFSDNLVRFYGASVAAALQYLHTLGIVYRDIKPENVFIDSNGYIKLGDFGFAKQINNGSTYTFCGTPGYLAPETIYSHGYDLRIDWWSYGVLLYVIATGQQPFAYHSSDEPAAIIGRIVDPEFSISYPPYLSRPLLSLMKACMERDVEQRLGDETIQTHVFFKDKINFDELTRCRIPGPDVSRIRAARDKRIGAIVSDAVAGGGGHPQQPQFSAGLGGDGEAQGFRGGLVAEGQPLDAKEIERLNEIFLRF